MDAGEESAASHDALLRAVFTSGQQLTLPPHATVGPPEDGRAAPGNPSKCILLLVPIRQNEQVVGLLEIFQETAGAPWAPLGGFLQYMTMMADLAGRYHRGPNARLGRPAGAPRSLRGVRSAAAASARSKSPSTSRTRADA